MIVRFKAYPITRTINKFLSTNGFDCKAKLDTDFCYYYNSSTIGYPVVMQKEMDNYFMDFAESLGLNVDCGCFILSLFHEIGHNETLDDIDDKIRAYCQDVKATLSSNFNDIQTYFRLEDEIRATRWAVNYINKHPMKIKMLTRQLEKEFEKFYKKVNIED